MDHTGEPSKEIDLQPNESRPNNTAYAGGSFCADADLTATRQPYNDQIPSTLGTQVQALTEESHEAVEATTKSPPYHCHCACVITGQRECASSDSHDAIRIGQSYPFGEHGLDTDRIYSEMGDISDVSSQGHEPLEKLDSVPDLVLPEGDDDNLRAINKLGEASAVS
jgi:hypothetical protein